MSEEGSEGAEGSEGSEGEIQTRKSFCWVIALEMASAGVPVCHIDDDDAVVVESDVGWSGCCWSDGAVTASVLLSIVIWDGGSLDASPLERTLRGLDEFATPTFSTSSFEGFWSFFLHHSNLHNDPILMHIVPKKRNINSKSYGIFSTG